MGELGPSFLKDWPQHMDFWSSWEDSIQGFTQDLSNLHFYEILTQLEKFAESGDKLHHNPYERKKNR